jgi:hypothetical protein
MLEESTAPVFKIEKGRSLRFEVLTAVSIMIMIFWDIALCSVVTYFILRVRNVGTYLPDCTHHIPEDFNIHCYENLRFCILLLLRGTSINMYLEYHIYFLWQS